MPINCLFQVQDAEGAEQLHTQLLALDQDHTSLIKRAAHNGREFYEITFPVLLATSSIVKTWIRERAATRRATRLRYGGLEMAALDAQSAEELIKFLDALRRTHDEGPDICPTIGDV